MLMHRVGHMCTRTGNFLHILSKLLQDSAKTHRAEGCNCSRSMAGTSTTILIVFVREQATYRSLYQACSHLYGTPSTSSRACIEDQRSQDQESKVGCPYYHIGIVHETRRVVQRSTRGESRLVALIQRQRRHIRQRVINPYFEQLKISVRLI